MRTPYGDPVVASTALDECQLWIQPYIMFTPQKVGAKDGFPEAAALLLVFLLPDRGRQPEIKSPEMSQATDLGLAAPQRAAMFGCRSLIQSAVKTEPVCRSGFRQGSKIPK